MRFARKRGSTSNMLRVFIPDNTSTTGAGLSGLTSASTNLQIAYMREFDAAATIYAGGNIQTITTIGTFQQPTANTQIRFKEVDSVNFKGVYELHFHDTSTAFGSGDTSTNININILEVTTAALKIGPNMTLISLVPWNWQDGAALGLTNLDAAVSSRMATYAQPTGFLAATFPSGTIANQTNITGGTITTTTNLTNLPSIPANWLTAAGINAGALNGKGDWLLASSYTAPPTTAQIATGVWQDSTAGDFTVASSIGKALFTGNFVPGAAGGLFIAGSNAATTVNFTGTITTVTNLTNLPSIPANWLTSAGINAGALNGKGDWLLASSYTAPPTAAQNATAHWQDATAGDFTVAGSIGKSLFTSGNAPGAASGLALVGSNMGSAASVTAGVTVTTNNDKTGYALTAGEETNIATAVNAIWTSAMTESYSANGATMTPVQALYEIAQNVGEFAISGTTITMKKRDHATTAETFTLDSSTNPTSRTRAT